MLANRQRTLGGYLRTKFRSSQMRVAEKRPVFGVPIHTSMRYANVAISLFNDEGQSYIYGYIPTVVGKTAVFMKEKGMYQLYAF